jgi:predicted DNA-binding ribbon-helix-helix protein
MKSSPSPAVALEGRERDTVVQSTSFTKGTPHGRRKTSFNLDKEFFKEFAVYARLHDMTMTELVQKAIREYMERHNEPCYPTSVFTVSGTVRRSPVDSLKHAIVNAGYQTPRGSVRASRKLLR